MTFVGTFARHPVASTILTALVLFVGLFALDRINTQFFPNFGIDAISVTVDWPGASAEDIDLNIVDAIEPEVRFLDGVKKVRSTSQENLATIFIEFLAGTDMQSALSEVETAVANVRTLPEESERPKVSRITRYDTITRLVISGPFPEKELKSIAKRMRDDLLALGVDKIDLVGARDEEVWVELAPETLVALDITLKAIADTIAGSSTDIPSGDTQSEQELQIRTIGRDYDAGDYAKIDIRTLQTGEKIVLEDVATVSDTWEEGGTELWMDGYRAIELHVQRSLTADALSVANTVDRYVAELGPTLPAMLRLHAYNISANVIRDRINLLLTNGATGFVLVIIVLFLFLNSRIAFWVAAGIPIALLTAIIVMLLLGRSVNMVSLFGLILALGLIVDDAIVVAEETETQRRNGLPAEEAAVVGASRMTGPVLSSSLTTVAALIPLLLISDIIGEIIREIPLTVIFAVIASLFECFVILPGHLRGALASTPSHPGRVREFLDCSFMRFRSQVFEPIVTRAVRQKYLTVTTAMAAFIVVIGLIVGGRVGFVFFPSPEADRVYANVRMVAGTPRDETIRALERLMEAAVGAERQLTDGGDPVIRFALTKVGVSVGRADGSVPLAGDNVGGITIELIESETRSVRTRAFIDTWSEVFGRPPGVETVTITPAIGGPPGRDLDIRIVGSDLDAMSAATDELLAVLEGIPGLGAIEDDLIYGRPEILLEVTAAGRALGFDTEMVGQQVRHAFEGAIAQRVARGDEEVTVRVLLDESYRTPNALNAIYIRTDENKEVALQDIVRFDTKTALARIQRENGRRQIAITGDIDPALLKLDQLTDLLQGGPLPEIVKRHGVDFVFAGKSEETENTLADMKIGAIIALVLIFSVLAWFFKSYSTPIIIMSIIPLSLVGVILGHLLLGYNLTILSLVATLGLSGIVVNDSIILVRTIESEGSSEKLTLDSIVRGTSRRLRAILLTSLTTIAGLTPMMFETSLQARFLIPMAVTIVFGLMIATFLVLLVVPALLAIRSEIKGSLKR